MKKKTLDILLRLRQYELECEQFKLYQRQKEEGAAVMNLSSVKNALQHVFKEGKISPTPAAATQSLNYLQELTSAQKICFKKVAIAKEATAKQIVATLDRHHKKEMFVRLGEALKEEERVNFEKQERLLLDDVGQSAFARLAKEVI